MKSGRKNCVALSLLLVFAAMGWAADAGAQQPVAPLTDCDRLAANPTDARRFSGLTGVQFKELRENLNAALSACSTAIATYPNELRFRYQYARAIQIKDKNTAFAIFKQLVAAKYPAAHDNVGWLLISENDDYPSAINVFQAGYALGDADCAVSLFTMIDKEKWQPPDANRVRLQLLEKAAAANHAGAVVALPIERAKQAQLSSPGIPNQPPASNADAAPLTNWPMWTLPSGVKIPMDKNAPCLAEMMYPGCNPNGSCFKVGTIFAGVNRIIHPANGMPWLICTHDGDEASSCVPATHVRLLNCKPGTADAKGLTPLIVTVNPPQSPPVPAPTATQPNQDRADWKSKLEELYKTIPDEDRRASGPTASPPKSAAPKSTASCALPPKQGEDLSATEALKLVGELSTAVKSALAVSETSMAYESAWKQMALAVDKLTSSTFSLREECRPGNKVEVESGTNPRLAIKVKNYGTQLYIEIPTTTSWDKIYDETLVSVSGRLRIGGCHLTYTEATPIRLNKDMSWEFSFEDHVDKIPTTSTEYKTVRKKMAGTIKNVSCFAEVSAAFLLRKN